MGWHTFGGIYNKDTEPDSRWDNLFENTLEVFEGKGASNINRDERAEIMQMLNTSLSANKERLHSKDYKFVINYLIKILHPGQTSSILIDSIEELNKIKKDYNGTTEGLFTFVNLKYQDGSGKSSEFRLFYSKDYNAAIELLDSFCSDDAYHIKLEDVLGKIELAAFCKGGDRRARWKLDKLHSEYGDFDECHKVGAKLTYLLLDILEDDLKEKGKLMAYADKIEKIKKNCSALMGKKISHFLEKELPRSTCPFCLRKIRLIDFFRNGRNDPFSISFGHYEFRGKRQLSTHTARNAFWIHRTCNYAQGEFEIKERIPFLKEVVNSQEKAKIDWDSRG